MNCTMQSMKGQHITLKNNCNARAKFYSPFQTVSKKKTKKKKWQGITSNPKYVHKPSTLDSKKRSSEDSKDTADSKRETMHRKSHEPSSSSKDHTRYSPSSWQKANRKDRKEKQMKSLLMNIHQQYKSLETHRRSLATGTPAIPQSLVVAPFMLPC